MPKEYIFSFSLNFLGESQICQKMIQNLPFLIIFLYTICLPWFYISFHVVLILYTKEKVVLLIQIYLFFLHVNGISVNKIISNYFICNNFVCFEEIGRTFSKLPTPHNLYFISYFNSEWKYLRTMFYSTLI